MMNASQIVKDLKQVLDQNGDKYDIDVGRIHNILSQCSDKEYLEIAQSAFDHYLQTKKGQYKSVFGIAITYARDKGNVLQHEDWSKLSNDMQKSVDKYNSKNQESINWNRLPSDIASMKTMVFTILNRDMISSVVSNLRRGLVAQSTNTRSFTRAVTEKQK
jgi:hypothetical protein